jgi:glycerol-3-phosphate dehydrogenase
MNRSEMVARARSRTEPWDIVIIGGGATGAGIAVDAASRGYDVLLLEREDFGKGTSSRATKLVHGGVRYLEQGNISPQECAAHRSRSSFHRAQLLVVGGSLLRHRDEGLRSSRRQV